MVIETNDISLSFNPGHMNCELKACIYCVCVSATVNFVLIVVHIPPLEDPEGYV